MKAFIRTYGCRANQYDTEAVRQMLSAAGVEETADPSQADVAIFNSCTVTASAEADLRADIRSAARSRPALRTIVMGCAAGVPSRDERVSPLATLPSVDTVIAGADLEGVAAAVGITRSMRKTAQTGARALLRIQDGCDEHCTFCATTLSRGANRSRALDDLVDEALILSGIHPEIVLTGIHIGTYGRDIGSTLSTLVEQLIVRVPRVRFRLTSIEASEVDDRLAEMFADDSERLAPHLHAPLQSGSDAVLKRMGRHWYSARSYEQAVSRITSRRQRFALSADVISGFPGETESDHAATLSLIDRLPFTSIHVFPYSPRSGTAALRLSGQVHGPTIRDRARQLRELGESKASAYAAGRIGGRCDVVVTERGKGLTEDYLSISVPDQFQRRDRFSGSLAELNGKLTALPA
jgi:threonylcarbamoyladenosine tRNA methylthiotransferase MtaB